VERETCNYIRCLGLNYNDHAKEAGFPLPKVPVLFTKPRNALIGPYPATVNIPVCAQDGTSDYESELCVVIGKSGRDISEEDALHYVLGYTASNDISARTLQLVTNQWSFSKGLDSSCPIGPVLVAPSVIPDPQVLAIKGFYNGETVQNGHTRCEQAIIFRLCPLISMQRHDFQYPPANLIFVTGHDLGSRNPFFDRYASRDRTF
jgi:2-keto-4-pentenoate hydratase/2-oxohepta-3-ene-1,7-dioic acid hydratase in catechol pathway